MQDDPIRQRVRARIAERGISMASLSRALHQHSGYVFEWLSGKQAAMPYENRLEMARLLDLEPKDVGVANMVERASQPKGLAEDAEPYTPPDGHYLARSPHIAYFRMKSVALDQHPRRILPGALLVFDLNRSNPADVPPMAIVVAQLYDRRELTRSFGTVIRQFVPPNKLITNSTGPNEIISLDDETAPFEAVIKGTFLSVVDEAVA